jgi:hypothetical protein
MDIEKMSGEELDMAVAKQKLYNNRWRGALFLFEHGKTIVVVSKIVWAGPSELVEGGTRMMFDNGSFLDIKDSPQQFWKQITGLF